VASVKGIDQAAVKHSSNADRHICQTVSKHGGQITAKYAFRSVQTATAKGVTSQAAGVTTESRIKSYAMVKLLSYTMVKS